jgi:pimeloyl-ACP methyl ester carboxylesterase
MPLPSFAPRCLAAGTVLLAGCIFQDVREQQALIDATCVIAGNAASSGGGDKPVVVVLLRPAGESAPGRKFLIADHFVLEAEGRWAFAAPPGDYRLAAFEDSNRDLRYQPGEPFLGVDAAGPIKCGVGTRARDIALRVQASSADAPQAEVDITALQARDVHGQMRRTLGQLTAAGELARLADARFVHDVAQNGLWRPFDFVASSYAGIYFLEPDDPRKTPVLFVHGMQGTPASFEALASTLDRSRFQPWFYYYPSGVHLHEIADHLQQTVAKVTRRHPHDRIIVVAHSMGGLVSRGFLLRHASNAGAARVPLFISISTPWDGHKAAELGVKHAPAVVRVWEDMAPGSRYLKEVFEQPLAGGTAHHLLYTHKRGLAESAESDDGAVTVGSQLRPAARSAATKVYGFENTHVGVLSSAEVSALVNRLLAEAR